MVLVAVALVSFPLVHCLLVVGHIICKIWPKPSLHSQKGAPIVVAVGGGGIDPFTFCSCRRNISPVALHAAPIIVTIFGGGGGFVTFTFRRSRRNSTPAALIAACLWHGIRPRCDSSGVGKGCLNSRRLLYRILNNIYINN